MPLSGSQIKLRYETSNGVECNLSVRTNPYTESGEEEVSEDLFYQLVATLAPIHRQVKPSERKNSQPFRERSKKTAYFPYFEQADLDSYLLEVPTQFQNGQRCWFLRFNESDEDKAHRSVLKKISEFIAKQKGRELYCCITSCTNKCKEGSVVVCVEHDIKCKSCGCTGAREIIDGSNYCEGCATLKRAMEEKEEPTNHNKRKAEKETDDEEYKKRMKQIGLDPVEWKKDDLVTINRFCQFQSNSIPYTVKELEAIADEVCRKIEERDGEIDSFTDLAIKHAMAKAVNIAYEAMQ